VDLAAARAIHVVAVVLWIGGVGMVTTVLLPALLREGAGPDAFAWFEKLEGRFAPVARMMVLLAGASGLYLVIGLDAWDRFAVARFWWMHAMVCLWTVFALILFVAEPLLLHRWLRRWAERDAPGTLRLLLRAHRVLLVLSAATIIGAVAGAHGF